MKQTIIIAAAAVALVAAGCVSPASDVGPLSSSANEALPHLELTDAHDHKDPAQHEAAWNLERIGWDPVAPSVDKHGRYNHVTLHGDLAFVTAYALEAGGAPGLAVYDISGDVPARLGTLETPDITPIDVHVSADGKYAILGGHRDNRVPIPAEARTCTGTPMVNPCTPYAPGGAILVDVSDPAAPTLVDTYSSAPSGAHTAKIIERDGSYHVYIASYGFSYANRLASGVEILSVDETPLGTKMMPVTRFFADDASGETGDARTFVHDIWIEEHPTAGDLMYVSYWDGGVVLVDVNDPANPQQVSAFDDFDQSLYGNLHFARPVGMIGDRHISFAAPEFGSAEHAGENYVIDTTDPTAPKLVTKWTLPGDPVNDGGYRFSPHNFDVRGTMLVFAHYHGGVWLLDLADPASPVEKGFITPVPPADHRDYEYKEDAPLIWAAQWTQDGTIIASDIGAGLYHLRVLSESPGEPPYNAFLG